ncbi:ABC transporter permease subunit [Sulfurimonas sp.]|uniref:PstC family ABC transporter permease n=1 Tax=Sulfurimonas sp. TaxID=2022749 RepID=UPI0025E4FB53|nr:ABC transporter permease subunit [Sulfurimonas sp.]
MNKLFSKLLLFFTGFSSSLVIFIFLLLSYLCIDLFNLNDISNFLSFDWDVEKEKFGIATMLFSTMAISFNALFLAFVFSFSICSIIFLSKNRYLIFFLEKTILLMSAIPTVIYAFAALMTIVPFISTYKPSSTLSILVASIVLSLLLIPTMSLIFLNIFKTLSLKYQSTCLNLGLSRDDFFFKFVLKNSYKNMTGGVILALSRAIGDTMIALMLAGNALSFPTSIFDSSRTLTSHIALIFANDFDSMAFKAIFFCAVLLLGSNFILIFIIKSIRIK